MGCPAGTARRPLDELLAGRHAHRRWLPRAALVSFAHPAPPFLPFATASAAGRCALRLGGRRLCAWSRGPLHGLRPRGRVRPDRLDDPAVLRRVVVPHAHHLVDPADSLRRPRLVNDGLDAVDHAAADDGPRQVVARLHGAGRQARQGGGGVFACTVASDPPCPVLSACRRSAASAPRTSPTTMWSGRCLSACRTRSRMVTPPPGEPARLEVQGVVTPQPQLQCVLDRDDPPLGASSDTRAFSSVVLPEPVPPEISRLRPPPSTAAVSSTTAGGSEPLAVSSPMVNDRPPKRRMVIAVAGVAGGLHTATREPSASRASMSGRSPGPRPAAGDLDRGPRHRLGRQRRGVQRRHAPAALDEARGRTVDHHLGDRLVVERAFESGRNGFRSAMVSSIYSSPASRRASTPVPAAESPA